MPISTLARKSDILFPMALCLLVNLTLLIVTAVEHPAYIRDYRLDINPDAQHYVLLGRNIYLHGAYSRRAEPPYQPDVLRTPLCPLFAGGLDLLGGPLLIYIAQILLHVSICGLVHRLASAVSLHRAAAIFAASFVAIHPTLVTLNFTAMSEMLFLFLLLLSVLQLLLVLSPCSLSRTRHALLAGILLGLSVLTRPAGLYFPVMIAVYLLVAGVRSLGWMRAARDSLVFIIGAVVMIAPWIIRNMAVFEIPNLTTNDTIVLVYFTGAGAYQVHDGIDREAAQQKISREFHIHPPKDMWNYHKLGISPAVMDREARHVILRVLLRYPGSLIESSTLGLVKAYVSHDAGSWARILGKKWINPRASSLLHFEADSLSRFTVNDLVLKFIFVIHIMINLILICLSSCGVIMSIRNRQNSSQIFLLLLTLAFFLLVCSANGYDAYSRFSAPSLPFACIFAGAAGGAGLQRNRANPR